MRGTGKVTGEERKREGTVSKGKTLRGKRLGIGRRKERKCEKSRNRKIAITELVGPTKLKRDPHDGSCRLSLLLLSAAAVHS